MRHHFLQQTVIISVRKNDNDNFIQENLTNECQDIEL